MSLQDRIDRRRIRFSLALSAMLVAGTAGLPGWALAQNDGAATSQPAGGNANAADAGEVVPDDASTPEQLLMFVKPGTTIIGRIDLERCDPRDAVALLSTFIKTSSADVPLKAKMAASVQREADREMSEFIANAREAGVLEMIGISGGFMNFDPDANGLLFRLRDGADVDAALTALEINREYQNVTVEGKFVVCRFNFGGGAKKPMMNVAKTNRAEVLKAIELAGDAPAMLIVAPPAGSLNAAKLAMPTLPDYLGAVETKDLVDGVDSLVLVGDVKDVRGRATVVCSNPQVFADAVKKLRTSFVEAMKAGTAPNEPYMTDAMIFARIACESAPELEVKDGAVELNVDEAAARKVIDGALPQLAEKFKENARYENERNMRLLVDAVQGYAADHQDAMPRTLAEVKPYLSENVELSVVSSGMLDDVPFVFRRPAGAGLFTPLNAAENVVLIHEQLDGRANDEVITFVLTNGTAESVTVEEFKQKLSAGTLKLADGGGGQGG